MISDHQEPQAGKPIIEGQYEEEHDGFSTEQAVGSSSKKLLAYFGISACVILIVIIVLVMNKETPPQRGKIVPATESRPSIQFQNPSAMSEKKQVEPVAPPAIKPTPVTPDIDSEPEKTLSETEVPSEALPVIPSVSGVIFDDETTATPDKLQSDISKTEKEGDASLEARLAALEKLAQAQQQQTEKLSLALETMKLEREKAEQQRDRQRYLMQRFADFRQQVQQGERFKQELAFIMQQQELSEEIKQSLTYLEAFSTTGIASMDELQALFQQNLQDYYRSMREPEPSENTPTSERAKRMLGSLVTIRKVGSEHQGHEDGDIIARAEAYLSEGRLNLAMHELRNLSVSASPYFKEWRKQAHAYTESQQILTQAERHLLESL